MGWWLIVKFDAASLEGAQNTPILKHIELCKLYVQLCSELIRTADYT